MFVKGGSVRGRDRGVGGASVILQLVFWVEGGAAWLSQGRAPVVEANSFHQLLVPSRPAITLR